MITDPKKKVTGLVPVRQNVVLLSWKFADEKDVETGNINVAIAALITSYGRCKLWNAINAVEEQRPFSVIYGDTDSIFYIRKNNENILVTGPCLGELTREVPPDEKVTHMFALAPKSYAYRRINDKTGKETMVMKCKGITLDANTRKTIDFNLVRDMALKFCKEGIATSTHVDQQRIHSDKKQVITNQVMKKIFQPTGKKRLICGEITLPIGYVCKPDEKYQITFIGDQYP